MWIDLWPFEIYLLGWIFVGVLLDIYAVWLVQSALEVERMALFRIAKILFSVVLVFLGVGLSVHAMLVVMERILTL